MQGLSTSAIYHPPKNGLPYLIVTVRDGEITSFMPVRSREEARAMIAAQNVDRRKLAPIGSRRSN